MTKSKKMGPVEQRLRMEGAKRAHDAKTRRRELEQRIKAMQREVEQTRVEEREGQSLLDAFKAAERELARRNGKRRT